MYFNNLFLVVYLVLAMSMGTMVFCLIILHTCFPAKSQEGLSRKRYNHNFKAFHGLCSHFIEKVIRNVEFFWDVDYFV